MRGAHDLRIFLEAVRDALLFGGREHGAGLRHVREGEREGRQHDGSGERQAEREPERTTRRVHAGRLAHPLLIDRGQGVVVELGHQQAQPRPCDHQRHEEVPAGIAARHDRDQRRHADRQEREAHPDDAARSARSRPLAGEERHAEHREREGRHRQTCLHRVVLEHHLQEDRDRDHRAAQSDLLQHLSGDPEPEHLRSEQVRVDQRRLPLALAVDEPVAERSQSDRADDQECRDRLPALLPHEDAQDEAAHPEHRKHGSDRIDVSRSGVGHVADATDTRQHDPDDHDLEREADAPRQEGRDEPAEQGPHRGRDRRRCTDQGVDPLLGRPFEVAVDEGLHRGQQQRGTEPADHGPEDDDRGHALSERHRQRTDGVREQTEDVRLLPADEVADLAADQDERGGDERLERDRRLDAADGRAQIMDDGRDRHVHQRGVDDEHEHRHREEHGEPLVERGLYGSVVRSLAHPKPPAPPPRDEPIAYPSMRRLLALAAAIATSIVWIPSARAGTIVFERRRRHPDRQRHDRGGRRHRSLRGRPGHGQPRPSVRGVTATTSSRAAWATTR